MIKFKAIDADNVRNVKKFKTKDLESAKEYVMNNLDKTKSWSLFYDEDE